MSVLTMGTGRSARPGLTFAHAPLIDQPSGTVVALTPAALLSSRGRPDWLVLDDVVDRRLLFADSDDYLRWLLGWIARLDEAMGASGALVAAAQLVRVPTDSLFVAARLLRAATSILGPATIRYVGPGGEEEAVPFHNGHLQFWPTLGDLPLAARLLPLIAAADALPYTEVATTRPQSPEEPLTRTAGGALKARLSPARHLAVGRLGRRRGKAATLVTWTGGYGIRAVLRSERATGARVLFLRRNRPETALLGFGPSGYRALYPPVPVAVGPSGALVPGAVMKLLDELDDWTGVAGVGAVLRSRFSVLVSPLLPVVEGAAAALAPQLKDAGVSHVVAANPSSIEEFAVLLAAGHLGIRRTLYQHGDHLFDYAPWLISETQMFETLVSSDPTLPDDLCEAARRLATKAPKIVLGRHRAAGAAVRRGPVKATYYLPTMFVGDTSSVPRTFFDDAWYLRWQLQVLGMMRSDGERQFVWKALPGSNQAPDPIEAIIDRDGIPNVKYETRPFLSVLTDVGRLLLDFPSTPLYEAVVEKVPVVCVAFAPFSTLRPRAVELFEGIVHICEDEPAALSRFREFLDLSMAEAETRVGLAHQQLLGQSGRTERHT